jgi:membrane-bound lytic murein transglycosylase A
MCTLLRGPWLFLPAALAILAATVAVDARRYNSPSPYVQHHTVTGAIPSAPQPAVPARVDRGPGPLTIPNAALEPATWKDLDGWSSDDHASAFATFYASCRPIVRGGAIRAETAHSRSARSRVVAPPSALGARHHGVRSEAAGGGRNLPALPLATSPAADARPVRAALEPVCARAVKVGRLNQEAARQFFETNFVPVRIRKLGDTAGFVTGYYEPIVDGSRFPTREFSVPLYRRPPDLVAPGYPDGGPFPNTGRALRRTPSGELVPYYDRGEIEDGALDGQHLELAWLRSATDALFIQIQGSARVRLEDGAMLRINYAAHNGYSYVPVGRVLIERGLVPREEMSMQRIREWMHDNPEGAKDVRRQNRSVVFFRITGLDDDTEAVGGQGIPLSPGRSIAVDKALHVYGTPFFIEADLPLTAPRSLSPFRRTMIAQDTGSAIVGPARADLYFGAGDEAGQVAGRIRQNGRFTILLPRDLDPSAAGARMPLPPVKLPPEEVAARALHAPAATAPLAEREEPRRVRRSYRQ